jgi:hypothetical protein
MAVLEVMAPPVPFVTEDEIAKLVMLAEQDAVLPPFCPMQFQLHGPDPITEDAVPSEQNVADGGKGYASYVRLSALPQMPLTASGGTRTFTA